MVMMTGMILVAPRSARTTHVSAFFEFILDRVSALEADKFQSYSPTKW